MRKIKFRGKNVMTGQIHYGFYSEYPVGNGRISHHITDKNLDEWQVEPESVAQLVGYDANGREVYEGDVLVFDNEKCRAQIFGELLSQDDIESYEIGEKIHGWKLK